MKYVHLFPEASALHVQSRSVYARDITCLQFGKERLAGVLEAQYLALLLVLIIGQDTTAVYSNDLWSISICHPVSSPNRRKSTGNSSLVEFSLMSLLVKKEINILKS